MSRTLQTLTSEHHEVLARLDSVEGSVRDGTSESALRDFATYLGSEIARHFDLEERALFPVLERHLGSDQGPLAVMNIDHAEFRRFLRELNSAVDAGDAARQRASGAAIIDLLRAHIAKEDQVLFPLAAQLLSPDELREVDAHAGTLDAEGTV